MKPTVAKGAMDEIVVLLRKPLHLRRFLGRSAHRDVLEVVAEFAFVPTLPILALLQVPEAPRIEPLEVVILVATVTAAAVANAGATQTERAWQA